MLTLYANCWYTVEPQLSGPRLSGTSCNYLAWQFSLKKIKKIMGVSAAVTMDTTEMFILFSYPAWLWNKGVRIIEVLLHDYCCIT